MQLSGVSSFRLTLAAVLGVAAMMGMRGDATPALPARGAAISSLGPFEVAAAGFEELSAIAVDAHGAVLVTDRRAGTATRIEPGGGRHTLLDNLHNPGGIAVDSAGTVFVVEAGTRVLRLDADGAVSVVASSIRPARALAAGPDGRLWLSTRSERGPGFDVVRLEASGALTSFASGLMDVRGMAIDDTAAYIVMASLAANAGRERTRLARIPFRADGGPGPIESMLYNTPRQAYGVAIDAAGDVFVSGETDETRGEGSGVVLKRRAGGQVDTVAAGLDDPVALTIAPNGDLFVIEKSAPARVLRFRAPPPPDVGVAPFTNRQPLRIDGRAQPGDLVRVFDSVHGTQALATTIADHATGAFALDTPLHANAETQLSLVATAAEGAGLVGPATAARIVHDDHLPRVAMTQPFPGAHVRGALVVRARAEDEGSGVALMQFMLGPSIVAIHNAAPGQPLVGAAVVDVASLTDGPHSLTVVATDRAGNSAATAQLLVVDRTPPETQILAGPPQETSEKSAVFTFGGTDVQSPNLEFAWRLDGGPWSAFSGSPTANLTSLTPGMHHFEVKARDRAGNEDVTPASQAFTVTTLRIRILEPAPGAVITTETMWVRGTVESGGRDVAVTIPLPLEFRNELSVEAMPAAVEAGTFAAEIPVAPGMTTLTVMARDGQGAPVTEGVEIEVQDPLSRSVRLEAFPPAGLAPHATRFATETFPLGSFYSLDLESNGTIDYEGDELTDREFLYARPGIHVALLRVTTPEGQMLTARSSVDVYDRITLEARLQAVWGAFRGVLRAGDVTRAASFVHSGRRAAWAEYFGQFTPALFAATETVFTEVTLLDVGPGRAECEMMRDVDGLLYSFPVSFAIDVDGGWRLWQF